MGWSRERSQGCSGISGDCTQCEGVVDDQAELVFSDPVDGHAHPTSGRREGYPIVTESVIWGEDYQHVMC